MEMVVHKMSFFKITKTLLRFTGKTKVEEEKTFLPRKHIEVRKTFSLSSSFIGSSQGDNFNQLQESFESSNTSKKTFKPKYFSQHIKSERDTRQNFKLFPDKVSRRKFSLKVVGGKLERRKNLGSCPDLTELGAQQEGGVSQDVVDSLDINTIHMFKDNQCLESELIEMCFE
jgi:hypothetical protein